MLFDATAGMMDEIEKTRAILFTCLLKNEASSWKISKAKFTVQGFEVAQET